MPKYHVTCFVTRERVLQIEADSEAEVRQHASHFYLSGPHDIVHDGPDFDWTVWDVEEVG
jgi:hypothetical protein